MSRRASRLRTEPPDRQPVLMVGALIIGVVVGLIAVPRLFSGSDGRVENYVLLASSLYSQGESPVLLRDRLLSVGITQPASTVLSMAQRFSTSRDTKQQHQAESLEAFGKVLLDPEAAVVSPTPRPQEPPVVVETNPALTPIPSVGTGTPPAASNVAAGATGTPPAGTPASGTPAATPTVVVVGASTPAAPGGIQRGKIKPPDGGSARLRTEPSQTSAAVLLIPNAAPVEILETVRGQSIEGESRWLRVRYGNRTGYLWSGLVAVGE